MRALIVLCVCFMMQPVLAKIYRHVDTQGNVTFSDKPLAKSTSEKVEEVELKEPMIMPSYESPVKTAKSNTATTSEVEFKPSITTNYNLNIVSPADDEGVRANDGTITVKLTTGSVLADGHVLIAMIDGMDFNEGTTSQTITLKNVDRGTHSLSVKVVDAEGQVISTSKAITFHVLRAIAK